jgi:anti-anti-sigma factor
MLWPRFCAPAGNPVVPEHTLRVRWTGHHAVVTFPEHVDASNAGQIREELLAVVNRGAAELIADMGATVSCDYAGADALVRAYQRAKVNGTQLRVVATAPVVRRVLEVSGLDRLISVYPDLEAAATAASSARALPFAREPDQPAADGQPGPRRPEEAPRGQPAAAAITRAVLWNIIDALADGVALVDDDGVLVLANRRLEEMFGYERGELTGPGVDCLIPRGLRAGHVRHRADYARDRRARPMGDRARLVGLRKDGATIPVEIGLSPVPTRTGYFTLAVVRDMTYARQRYDLAELVRAAVTEHEHREEQLLNKVVGSLFRVGQSLQAAVELPHDVAVRRISDAVQRLDDTIREIRDHVLGARGNHGPPDQLV